MGDNVDGALGDGSVLSRSTPDLVHGVDGQGVLTAVKSLSADLQSIAVLEDGRVAAWGANDDGQLGDGTTLSRSTPVFTTIASDGSAPLSGVTAAVAGGYHSAAVRFTSCDGNASATRVRARPSDGPARDLVLDSIDPTGRSSWSDVVTVSPDADEGPRQVSVCAIDGSVAVDCEEASRLGAPALASDVEVVQYVVDATPPLVATTSPRRFATVEALTTIQVTWRDSLSAVDPASVTMSIDGNPVSATVSSGSEPGETVVAASGAGIAPGIHRVTVSARDLAGNAASDAFVITLATVAATPGSATLRSQYVEVDPTGMIPPPATVTFRSPEVDISEFTESLNATTQAGYGQSRRSFALGSVQVKFTDNVGREQTVSVAVPLADESHQVGTLSPSAGPLEVVVPPHDTTIGDITVPVPVTFQALPYRATLLEESVTLGPHVLGTGEFFGARWETRAVVTGAIGVCSWGGVSETRTDCQVDNRAQVLPVVEGEPLRMLYVPTQRLTDESAAFGAVVQDCKGSECAQAAPRLALATSFAVRCPLAGLQGYSVNLCTGEIDGPPPPPGPWWAFLNAWLYQVGDPQSATGSRFPLWLQNHSEAPTTPSSCPNGDLGSMTAETYRLVWNVGSSDGSSGARFAGTWDDPYNRDPSDEEVYLGWRTGNDRGYVEESAVGYQLSNDPALELSGRAVPLAVRQTGQYLGARSGKQDSVGTFASLASSVTNGWEYAPNPVASGEGLEGTVGLIGGAEYPQPAVKNTYDLAATLQFQLILNSTCSAGA